MRVLKKVQEQENEAKEHEAVLAIATAPFLTFFFGGGGGGVFQSNRVGTPIHLKLLGPVAEGKGANSSALLGGPRDLEPVKTSLRLASPRVTFTLCGELAIQGRLALFLQRIAL